jgi:hypothetical protein
MLKITINKHDLFRVAFIGWIVLLVAGCNQIITSNTPSAIATETQAIPISPTEGEHQMTPSLQTPADAGLQGLIDKATADLAQRLSVSATEIILIEATSVVWPDASLGCPQEGMAYAQVLTPGYLIRLEFGNQEFEYHASRGTEVIYCENPTPPVPGTPPDI